MSELRKIKQRESLQAKHGPIYNAMQYTFWAEAILAGTHSGTDEPLALLCLRMESQEDLGQH